MSPPNQLTLIRVVLTPLFVWLLLSDAPGMKELALVVFVIAALTDWYDGWVARRWGYVTRWGKFFDPLADKVLTSAAFIAFVFIGYAEAWMVWVIVARDICITLLRSYGEYKHKPIDTSKFAKTKTFVQMVVIYVILISYVIRSSPQLYSVFGNLANAIASKEIVILLMSLTTLLTAWTGVLYFIQNWNIIKELFSSHARTAEID
jgi:CDP-diacylglycerol---glycerol-3-phosphate 3-phosphatidyltransferase